MTKHRTINGTRIDVDDVYFGIGLSFNIQATATVLPSNAHSLQEGTTGEFVFEDSSTKEITTFAGRIARIAQGLEEISSLYPHVSTEHLSDTKWSPRPPAT